GTTGNDAGNCTYVNQGRIEADTAGGTITIATGGHGVLSFTNQAIGTLRAGAGNLTYSPTSGSSTGAVVVDTGVFSLGANISAVGDGFVITGGTVNVAGTINNVGRTLNLGGGAWNLNGATISGGTVTRPAGSAARLVAATTSTASLTNGVTLNVPL